MNEMNNLSDEELAQVSGGGKAEEEYCGKWYVFSENPNRYAYVKKTNYDFYEATYYTIDEAGNVSSKDDSNFRALVLKYKYTEVSIFDLPEAIRRSAGC